MTRRLVLIMAIVVVLVVPAGAYEFQLVYERQIDGAETYQGIDPVIDDQGMLRGFLYSDDRAEHYLLLHLFGDTALRQVPIGDMLPSAASFVAGDTVVAFVTSSGTGYYGAYPPLYSLTFAPDTVITDSIILGESGCSNLFDCGLNCDGARLYWIRDSQGNRRLACSIDCVESWSFPTHLSYALYYSRTFVVDPTSLDTIWSADIAKLGTGDLTPNQGEEIVSIADYDKQGTTWETPSEKRSWFEVTDSALATLFSVHGVNQTSSSLFVGDYVPSILGDEIIFGGMFDSLCPDGCSSSYFVACFRMVDGVPQSVWCRSAGWSEMPVYVSESEGMVLCRDGSSLEVIDAGTGALLNKVDLPLLGAREYFEADGGLFHVVGRVHDTLRLYRLDLATDVPSEPAPDLPVAFTLHQNYPNPFNPSTTIEYKLSTSCHVRLDILNLLGQTVCTLLDEHITAGEHRVVWNGTDASGQRVASGVYLYRITTPGGSQSRQMLLLK